MSPDLGEGVLRVLCDRLRRRRHVLATVYKAPDGEYWVKFAAAALVAIDPATLRRTYAGVDNSQQLSIPIQERLYCTGCRRRFVASTEAIRAALDQGLRSMVAEVDDYMEDPLGKIARRVEREGRAQR